MNQRIFKVSANWVWAIAILLVIIVASMSRGRWLPDLSTWVQNSVASFRSGGSPELDGHAAAGEDAHAHAHAAHADHDEATSLELSRQALGNIGLSDGQIRPIEFETFRKSITVPAVVVERPGRTRVQVATPMTGVITHVHAVQGEAVEPGSLLFRIRLTHEDLVRAQTDFVKTLGELDVERQEISRLSRITDSGAVAGKVLLERQYAKAKLSALLQAQREALRLHGLSDAQVNQIASKRRLLQELRIVAPSIDDHDQDHERDELHLSRSLVRPVAHSEPVKAGSGDESTTLSPLVLQDLNVHKGQSVMAGETLCVLADYGELFIEGLAFEQDILQLRAASQRSWTVDAVFEQPGSEQQTLEGLEIAYLANRVDTSTRTLNFYVSLPNEVAKDRRADGNRYVEWKYLPGQRLQLRVPVEQWAKQIVLPVEAVAREGAEYFVFQQNGDHFDRVPVHAKYKDQYWVVIENDGALFPGDVVAMRGAHQMQMALKNKAGGGVDPHAGHSH